MIGLPMVVAVLLTSSSRNPCDDLHLGKVVPSVSAEAFVLGMQKATPNSKGVYETTAAYEARSQKKLQDYLDANQFIVFRKDRIHGLSFRYDADTQELRYEEPGGLGCTREYDKQCLTVHLADEELISTLKSYEIVYTPRDQQYTPFPTMKVSPDRAKSIREGEINLGGLVSLLMVVQPEAPYFESSTRSGTGTSFRFYQKSRVPVRLLCTSWVIDEPRN